jgi:ABC-2 type transport system permease protein
MTTPSRLSSGGAARRLLRIYALEAKTELLKSWRVPAYSLSTLAFPLMFYLIFGVSFGRGEPPAGAAVNSATYLLATYGAFGIIGAALFGFGISVAIERGQGWMRLKRASPMPPGAYFVAKIAMALFFSILVALTLFAVGWTLGGVALPLAGWLSLFGVLVLGVFPFCAMGLAFGYLLGPNSAPVALNLIYLPMAFASGLWLPIFLLPELVQRVAVYLPPYHYAQLALKTLGADEGTAAWAHVLWLVGFTALFLWLAVVAYRRDEGKTYG